MIEYLFFNWPGICLGIFLAFTMKAAWKKIRKRRLDWTCPKCGRRIGGWSCEFNCSTDNVCWRIQLHDGELWRKCCRCSHHHHVLPLDVVGKAGPGAVSEVPKP